QRLESGVRAQYIRAEMGDEAAGMRREAAQQREVGRRQLFPQEQALVLSRELRKQLGRLRGFELRRDAPVPLEQPHLVDPRVLGVGAVVQLDAEAATVDGGLDLTGAPAVTLFEEL